MHDDTELREQRSSMLSSILALLAVGGVCFASFLICGGLTLYILAVVVGSVRRPLG